MLKSVDSESNLMVETQILNDNDNQCSDDNVNQSKVFINYLNCANKKEVVEGVVRAKNVTVAQ